MKGYTEYTALISASPETVWEHLVIPELMTRWMGEPEMQLKVNTTWLPGRPITISGFHHGPFENKGTVLAFEPHRLIRYTHLSSVSRLPDRPENHTSIEFHLTIQEHHQTLLSIRLQNFPTENIFKHLAFYWSGTPAIIKAQVEALP